MTTDLKKNSQPFLESLDQLERIRVTGVKDFHACPRMWKAKQLGEGVQKESPYAKRGTAVHYVVERYLKQLAIGTEDGGHTDVQTFLRSEGVPDDEIENVFRYLEALKPLRPHLIEVEKGVTFGRCSHWRPVSGHVDALFRYNDEGDVLILDHKTNRSFRGSDWWKHQPQPRFYAWLVRHLIPTARDIYFAIGYVNLGRRVVWRTDPADDKWCYERYTALLDELRVYARTGEWPERINPDCRYCPLKSTCATFRRSLDTDVAVLDTDLKMYQWYTGRQKALESILEDVRERLTQRLTQEGDLVENGYRAYLRPNQRRTVSFANALDAVAPSFGLLPGPTLKSEVDALEEIFSVKVGGLDKFFEQHPEAADRVSRLVGSIVTVKQLAPTLTVEETQDADREPARVHDTDPIRLA